MNDPKTATLHDVRAAIDALDGQIVELIANRQRWVEAAGALKSDEQAVRAPDRVEQVISKVRGLAVERGASPEVVEAAYRALVAAFIEHELAVHSDAVQAGDARLAIRPALGPDEYPALVDIWRSAVRATHDFLAEGDFARIEGNLAAAYFPAVTLVVAERGGVAVGFAGVAEGGLEMLFVDDSARGTGVGSALLAHAIERLGVTRVDVNEQNPGAHGFYVSRGFEEVGRSELDGDGQPYPILHLALAAR
ncbi:chorismate mutase [Leucobacter komagatae]|uniref:Chorismate mutase n=1 Tax=Leucobacter komagatae TaxID=55969 RepID=A0A542Y679_9MICO|nr:GNAT family N-acetyltransferase [Leucobacter komagatae]TQL43527.1 chorismate mutase [Leucobacter komagatae]